MMRIALTAVFLVALLAAAYVADPDEFKFHAGVVIDAGTWAWNGVRANPVPVSLAAGTFLLTVIYHKAKGKSLRESVEVAATRVTVVPVSVADAEDENPVVKRAKARAMRAQLITDQIGLQNRQRKLPEELVKAEKEACYTEQAVAEAERMLAEEQKDHEKAVARLEALRKEKAESEAELAEIDAELRRLAELV
jgi:hypothetical protein